MTSDANTLELQHYMVIVGGVMVLLALVLYAFRGAKLQIPAVVGCGIGALVAGVALGVMLMAGFGYHWEKQTRFDAGEVQSPLGGGGGGPPMGMGGGGAPGKGGGMMGLGGAPGKGGGAPGKMGGAPGKPGGGGGGGRGGFGGGGGGAPNSKRQLATLVAKLDLLTGKPPAVNLTSEQRQKISEQLDGLKDMAELSEDNAKARLDKLLELLKDNQAALEAVGYRWPGAQGGGQPADTPNPFKDASNASALDGLQGRLKEPAKK